MSLAGGIHVAAGVAFSSLACIIIHKDNVRVITRISSHGHSNSASRNCLNHENDNRI